MTKTEKIEDKVGKNKNGMKNITGKNTDKEEGENRIRRVTTTNERK